jgi:hypothetical protein
MSCCGNENNKRKADFADEVECEEKRIKIDAEEQHKNEYDGGDEEEETQQPNQDETNHSKSTIDEAIKTLDRIQYELNMNNFLLDSPETSDHDTPPDSDDESHEEMLSQAHALGFAACVKETFRFLDSCGIAKNDPIYKQLKSRFIEMSN